MKIHYRRDWMSCSTEWLTMENFFEYFHQFYTLKKTNEIDLQKNNSRMLSVFFWDEILTEEEHCKTWNLRKGDGVLLVKLFPINGESFFDFLGVTGEISTEYSFDGVVWQTLGRFLYLHRLRSGVSKVSSVDGHELVDGILSQICWFWPWFSTPEDHEVAIMKMDNLENELWPLIDFLRKKKQSGARKIHGTVGKV